MPRARNASGQNNSGRRAKAHIDSLKDSPPTNLYTQWLARQVNIDYEKEHGVTKHSKIPVTSFETPEGWSVRLLGPEPEPQPPGQDEAVFVDFDCDEEEEVVSLWAPYVA